MWGIGEKYVHRHQHDRKVQGSLNGMDDTSREIVGRNKRRTSTQSRDIANTTGKGGRLLLRRRDIQPIGLYDLGPIAMTG